MHQVNDPRIAEVIAENIVNANTRDGIDLFGNSYFQDRDKIVYLKKYHS